jgi:hypothetical protein
MSSFKDQTEYAYECAGCKGWHNNIDPEAKTDPGWWCGNCDETRPGQQLPIKITNEQQQFSKCFAEVLVLIMQKMAENLDQSEKMFILRKKWVDTNEWIRYHKEGSLGLQKYVKWERKENGVNDLTMEDLITKDWGYGYILNENTIQILG